MSRPPDPTQPLVLRSKVPAEQAGKTLLDYLCRRFPYHDREQWRAEIAAGRLHVAGRAATAELPLAVGCQVTYLKPHREPWACTELPVLHRDARLAVVAKPAHLPMHADGPFVRHTLVHLLSERLGTTVQLAHRLDRETSGVVCVALDRDARRQLGAQFEAGLVAKRYLAVVRGRREQPFTIDAAIGHAAGSEVALRRSARTDARDAQVARTDFVPLATSGAATLLACTPHTGRTHQLRVHLEHAGLPILGDKLYGRPDADYLAFVHRVKAGGDARDVPAGEPDRQLLHAWSLRLRHPDDERALHFVAPPPADFAAWLAQLGLPLPDESAA